jgi:hypothetical protein
MSLLHHKINESFQQAIYGFNAYRWADNPVINLFDCNGLPVTPLSTQLVGEISVDRSQ